jgi:hypothetical protein
MDLFYIKTNRKGIMDNKKFKDMSLDELLETDLSLDSIDDIIEWDYQVEKKKESKEKNE